MPEFLRFQRACVSTPEAESFPVVMLPLLRFEEVLGQVLAEERKRARLSQAALASRSKLHPTYISQLERGLKSPTVRALQAIAGALGTTATEILRRAEKAAEPSTR